MILSDTTISHMVKLLQVAILSGTDLVDHLRQMDLTEESGKLEVAPESVEVLEKTIQEMMTKVPGAPES